MDAGVQQVNEVKINVVYVTPDGKPVSEALPLLWWMSLRNQK